MTQGVRFLLNTLYLEFPISSFLLLFSRKQEESFLIFIRACLIRTRINVTSVKYCVTIAFFLIMFIRKIYSKTFIVAAYLCTTSVFSIYIAIILIFIIHYRFPSSIIGFTITWAVPIFISTSVFFLFQVKNLFSSYNSELHVLACPYCSTCDRCANSKRVDLVAFWLGRSES